MFYVLFFDRGLQVKRTKKQDAKPNKGLRHFSVKVSELYAAKVGIVPVSKILVVS